MCLAEPKPGAALIEFRCVKCNKLLFKGSLSPGTRIEVICTRCKEMNQPQPIIDKQPVT